VIRVGRAAEEGMVKAAAVVVAESTVLTLVAAHIPLHKSFVVLLALIPAWGILPSGKGVL
jgi:hypothetical protein